MRATPMYPIAAMHGGLTDHYYCRMLKGHLIIQRKPCRRGHVPTPREAANQHRFATLYRASKGRPLGDHSVLTPS